MAQITKLWSVCDPTPDSELGDILAEHRSVDDFAKYVVGTGIIDFKHLNHALYTSAGEARKNAEARMKKKPEARTAGVNYDRRK